MQEENKLPFFKRFLIYQKERFPFIAHGIMIAAFTFSAISYSRLCRNQKGFIAWSDFVIGVFATITLFFLYVFLMSLKIKKMMQNIENTYLFQEV